MRLKVGKALLTEHTSKILLDQLCMDFEKAQNYIFGMQILKEYEDNFGSRNGSLIYRPATHYLGYYSGGTFIKEARLYPDKEGVIYEVHFPLTNNPMVPIGVIPKSIWEAKRIEELKGAIERYLDAKLTVKEEWIEEYNELISRK